MPGLSRRAVLLGAVGLAAASVGGYELIQDGTLPGRYNLAELMGACGAPPPPPTGPLPSQHVVSFYSAYRRCQVRMVTLIPARAVPAARLRVVVAMHGADSDAVSMAAQVRPAMASAQLSGLAVICVDGGNTYWHARADGDDPVGMILYEALPRARMAGLRTSRIAVAGESMGGYGALLLAERLAAASRSALYSFAGMGNPPPAPPAPPGAPPAVAAVAALTPAIFGSYANARAANRAAFDGPADFSRNDVFAGIGALRKVPAWIACGSDDPFEPEIALFRARLAGLTRRRVPGGILPGCHDDAFWERNLPAALKFAAKHLT